MRLVILSTMTASVSLSRSSSGFSITTVAGSASEASSDAGGAGASVAGARDGAGPRTAAELWAATGLGIAPRLSIGAAGVEGAIMGAGTGAGTCASGAASGADPDGAGAMAGAEVWTTAGLRIVAAGAVVGIDAPVGGLTRMRCVRMTCAGVVCVCVRGYLGRRLVEFTQRRRKRLPHRV